MSARPAASQHEAYFVAKADLGGWIVTDHDGVAQGLFMTKTDAMLFACRDRARAPRPVILSPDKIKIAHGSPMFDLASRVARDGRWNVRRTT